MSTKKVRQVADQRLDLNDQDFLIDQAGERINDVMRSLVQKGSLRGSILKGFQFEEVPAALSLRLRDLESFAVDSAGHVIARPVTGATEDYSVAAFAGATNIYVHLYEKEVDTDFASRRKFDTGANAEVQFNTFTRDLLTYGVYMTVAGFTDSADPSDADDPGVHKMIQVGIVQHDGAEVDSWVPTPASERQLMWESAHSDNEVGNRIYFKPGAIEFAGTVNGALGAASGTVPVNENIVLFPAIGTLLVGHGVFDGTNDQEILEYTSHDGGNPGTFTLLGTTANPHVAGDPVSVLSPGGLEWVVNAKWTGSTWDKDVDDMAASKTAFSAHGQQWRSRAAANNAVWADTAWDESSDFDFLASHALTLADILNVGGVSNLKDQLRLGANTISSAVAAAVSRVSHEPWKLGGGGAITCLMDASPEATQRGVRMYYKNDDGGANQDQLMIVMGATFDGTNWNRDVGGAAATRMVYAAGGWQLQLAPGDTFLEAAWTDLLDFQLSDGVGEFDTDVIFNWLNTGVRNNPASTTSVTNSLRAKGQVKAWGNLTCDGAGGVVVNNGYNITSVSISGTDVLVNFGGDFADTLYAVVAIGNISATTRRYHATATTVGQATIRSSDNTGVTLSLDAAVTFYFIAIGEQSS